MNKLEILYNYETGKDARSGFSPSLAYTEWLEKRCTDLILKVNLVANSAHSAIEYVGAANYQERIDEAHKRVDAISKLGANYENLA